MVAGDGCNDGKALVLVDLEAEKAPSHASRKRPDEHPVGRPDERRTIEALESPIATLKGDIAKGEVLAEQRLGEIEAAHKRLDEMVVELVALNLIAEHSKAWFLQAVIGGLDKREHRNQHQRAPRKVSRRPRP